MRLLILSASARFIASSCIRAGLDFNAVDLFGDWDLQQLCVAPRENVNKCRQVNSFQEILAFPPDPCDFVILGGGIENQPELIRKLNRNLHVKGTSAAQLNRLNDPKNYAVLAVAIRSVGGMAPQIKTSITAHDVLGRWLRKKLSGAGGRHVRFASLNDIDLAGSNDYVFQQCIDGELVSAVFVAVVEGQKRNCKLLGLSRQLVGESKLGASPFAYCGSIGPLDPLRFDCKTIESIGQAISSEFQIAGVFGIDFIVNSAGVWPVDINPRIPSSAELFDLNDFSSPIHAQEDKGAPSIAAIHLAACVGEFLSRTPGYKREIELKTDRLGKGVLYWRPPDSLLFDQSRLEFVTGEHWNAIDGTPPRRWVADIPSPERIIRHGDPVLSLFVRESTEERVYESLLRYARELELGLAMEVV